MAVAEGVVHTDSVEIVRRRLPLLRAAAATAALLGACWALRWVPLPGVNSELLAGYGFAGSRLSLGTLGINSLLVGFFLVELFSFSPPGRRRRDAGAVGRARLNQAALALSLLLAGVQAMGLALYLERMTSSLGMPLVDHPGSAFRMLIMATLVAAAAAVFGLATAIGEWGIGNGFSWLWVLAVVQETIRIWRPDPAVAGREAIDLVFGGLWVVPVVALVTWIALQRPAVQVATAGGETLKMWLPPLPQGVLPIYWTEYSLGLAAGLGAWWHLGSLSALTPVQSVGARLLLVPAFSLLAFALVGARRRVAANLRPIAEVAPRSDKTLDAQFVTTTLFLTVGSVALYLIQRLVPAAPPIQLGAVLGVTAMALDLRDELAFKRRHGATVRLLRLDNVHFACYLQALLDQRGIAVLARAHRFRSLHYFFFPLVKIDLLVGADHAGVAAVALAEQEPRTI